MSCSSTHHITSGEARTSKPLHSCIDSSHPSQQIFSHVRITVQRIKCFAQGHNTVPQVRPVPMTLLSPVEHFTTELCGPLICIMVYPNHIVSN